MRYSLTICFVTSRLKPNFAWFALSLCKQLLFDEQINVIVVDTFKSVERAASIGDAFGRLTSQRKWELTYTEPKPTIWSGSHRITKEDWWSKSNSLNTSIALCKTDWIAFVDDRSFLDSRWLQAIREAMDKDYAVCGSYEKRANMKVENGVIVGHGETLGVDTRTPGLYSTDGWYGGSGALPLDWCLAVNGFSEDYCDSLGSEDSMFGSCLYNAGFPMKYDSTMRIIEDRTPGELDGALKRADKGVSPTDKSHAIVAAFAGQRTSMNSFNIREVRESVLGGNPFPSPSASHLDWYDGQPISEMT